MKNKLDSAYNPDKQTRKEKVLVALSGGVDSLVTSYLLKLQKYDLVAVTIVNSWDEVNLEQEKILSCHLSQSRVDEIKAFCHKLGIPHQVIKAGPEFKEYVIEPWIADKALGRKGRPCWSCHELKMNLILEKMQEVGAQKIATGHYAKLFRHEAHDSVFVHTSNDEVFDQSALLSRMSHDFLKHLILPLSDLTKKEVLKLAENFGVTAKVLSLKMHACLSSPELTTVLEKNIPKKFLQDGEITNAEGSFTYGRHEGIHGHSLGELVEIRFDGKPQKGVFSNFVYSEKRMVVVEPDFLKRSKILLTKCVFSEEVSWPEPVKGVAVLSPEKILECWIYPKSLSSVYLEFSEDAQFLNGEIISVLRKKGKNSKVLLTGQVRLLPPDKKDPEEGEKTIKVDPILDF